jgi:hypothetical protein
MRVVQAAALTAAALLLTSVASAQGLGDAAAAARQKRQAEPAKPTKVYTEGDIGESMAPVSTTRDLPAAAPATSAPGAGAAAGGSQPAGEPRPPVEGQPGVEGQAPAEGAALPDGTAAAAKNAEEAAKAEAEAQAKAAEAWRKRLDQARKEEAVYKDIIDKVQVQLNGTNGLYSPGRASNVNFLEENKQKLAETQAKIAALEDEGSKNGYR